MEEQLVSFKTAKLAKKKGFDIHCRWHFNEDDMKLYENEDFPYNSWNGSLFAPTLSLLQKWLRDVKNIIVLVGAIRDEEDDVNQILYFFSVFGEDEEFEDSEYYHDYEETLEKGLLESLKLI